ncbi:USP48 [Bugula neritina]|uniref:USP48 n=1 Tax=Bugula neritina TaxID=10212 RepID=A0A7J7JA92_BUGNE|nr:USP48 [Bugula neritina]
MEDTPTSEEEIHSECKKPKLDLTQCGQTSRALGAPALTGSLVSHRKSARRKHVRGDKHLKVSSRMTLKDLRVEVIYKSQLAQLISYESVISCWSSYLPLHHFDQMLTLDGRKLEGDDMSLTELKLYPGCLLFLKGETYDEGHLELALLQQGVMEEGFRGTGLMS